MIALRTTVGTGGEAGPGDLDPPRRKYSPKEAKINARALSREVRTEREAARLPAEGKEPPSLPGVFTLNAAQTIPPSP
jgi:hypothetical protein